MTRVRRETPDCHCQTCAIGNIRHRYGTLSFSQTFSDWREAHDRYRLLRSLNQAPLRNRAGQEEQDREIECLECLMEELIGAMITSASRSASEMEAILTALVSDLQIRHQIKEDDPAVCLALTACLSVADRQNGQASS